MKTKRDNDKIDLGRERQRRLEHRLSLLNSQLCTSLDVLTAEIGKLKQVSDDISTLYEDLNRFTSAK